MCGENGNWYVWDRDLNIFVDSGKASKGNKGDKGDDGEQGEQGIPGIQGAPGQDGRDGQNGQDGADGQDGYTPQKGVDYWTNQDKEEIVDDVIEAITPTLDEKINGVKVDGDLLEKDEDNNVNIDLSRKEDITNKITSIDENSTDTQYPSAKCVYDKFANERKTSDIKYSNALKGIIDKQKISTIYSANSYLQNVKIFAESTQEVRSGKNLFDKTAIITNKYVGNRGTLVNQNDINTSDYILVVPEEKYSQTTAQGGNNYGVSYYDADKNFLRVSFSVGRTFTVPADVYYIRMSVFTADLDTYQFEQGSTNTSYEAFGKSPSFQFPSPVAGLGENGIINVITTNQDNESVTKVVNITGHQPLQGTEDVEDDINFNNKKISRKIGKKVLDGTENCQAYVSKNSPSYYCYYMPIPNDCIISQGVLGLLKCNILAEGTWDNIYAIRTDTQIIALRDNGRFYIRVPFATKEELKTYLAEQYTNGTPVIIYYPLATQIEEDIEELPEIPTTEGTTVIECDGKLSATYNKDINKVINDLQSAILTLNGQGV